MRQPATYKRCCTVMYPGPSGSAENHKRAYRSDGAKQQMAPSKQNQDPPQTISYTLPKWPQPQGIFTNGSGNLLMEHEAFASMLVKRLVFLADGSVIFKL